MRARITGSCVLHTWESCIFQPARSGLGGSGSDRVRLEEIVLLGIGKIDPLCNPPKPVMHALIDASRTVPEWYCITITMITQIIIIQEYMYISD